MTWLFCAGVVVVYTCFSSLISQNSRVHGAVEAIHFDMPYDKIPDTTWDEQPTQESIVEILKQVDAINSNPNVPIFLMHKPADAGVVWAALEERGFKHITPWYWHKTDHQGQTPTVTWTSSVEQGVVAYQGNRQVIYSKFDMDPRKRHNFIEMKSVTTLARDDNGAIVNVTEKPPGLAKWLFEHHCLPGSTVLIIGAGAGGCTYGATLAGCNVVAVEQDEAQFKALQRILVARQEAELKEMASRNPSPAKPAKKSKRATNTVEQGRAAAGEEVKEEGGDAGQNPKCVDCGEAIAPGGYDPTRVCSQCTKFVGPLHENCAVKFQGEWWCATCADAENVSVLEEEADQVLESQHY